MTALLAESIGQLRIAIAQSESRIDELAFRSANEIIDRGDSLIVVDAAGCFEPARMTHAARTGAIDPALLLKKIRVLPARSAGELEDIILHQLKLACDRIGTRHVLITDPLSSLYKPTLSTRDAARMLGRMKSMLETLAMNGFEIVVVCRRDESELGTRSHFLSSLIRASATA
jgi:hypothetical protein